MSRLNGNRAQAQSEHLKVNVAILGAGRIAHAMATTLVKMAADPRYADLVAPYAVAARDGERAAAFAAQYGFPVSYGSYEELLADPQVDLVYIATPHSLHAEQGIMCLQAGKNILVEKSFTANAAQARELLAVAEASGLLCTEAIWTRYMPSRRMIDDIVASGVIGEVKMVDANLCYPVSGKARMTDPAWTRTTPSPCTMRTARRPPRRPRCSSPRTAAATSGARTAISSARTSTTWRASTSTTTIMSWWRIMTCRRS